MTWILNFLLLRPTYRVQGLIIWITLIVLIGSLGYGHWQERGGFSRKPSSVTLGNVKVVTIDLLWLANSQHAAAMQLSGLGAQQSTELTQEEATLALTRTSKRIQKTVKEIAGPNTVVMVRQAIAFGGDAIPDITQQVLEALELPVNVPHEAVNAYSGESSTQITASQLRESDAAAARVGQVLKQAEIDREDQKTGNLLP